MSCPLCNSLTTKEVYGADDYFFASTSAVFPLTISHCAECDFVFQSGAYCSEYDTLAKECYEAFHKSENFSFPRKREEYETALGLVTRNTPKKKELRVLDIGSNRGDFLYWIKQEIPDAVIQGVEPTKLEYQVPTINAFFSKELFDTTFDVICLQHVLEHIKYPQLFLEEVISCLSEDGILYIEVPYLVNSLKYKIEDFSLEHVNYFSAESLKRCTGELKLQDIHTEPFLRAIFSRASEKSVSEQKIDVVSLLDEFQKSKKDLLEKLISEVNAGKELIFYGTSYYYRLLYSEIANKINHKNIFFYDDNLKESTEPCFGLKRKDTFGESSVVLLCSNNFYVQEKMADRVSSHKGATVFLPWQGVRRF